MAIVLCPAVKKRHAEREKIVTAAIDKARKAELDMLHSASGGVISELQHICATLLEVAQKYVPKTPGAYVDADSVTRCANALREMAMQPVLMPQFTAAVDSMGPKCVINSFEYRYLRNKAIAGFATIADLTTKPSAGGTFEYQNGVREGYRRTSEIAIMFLNDIQGGTADGR